MPIGLRGGTDSIGLLLESYVTQHPSETVFAFHAFQRLCCRLTPVKLNQALLLHFRAWFREEFAYGHAFAVVAL